MNIVERAWYHVTNKIGYLHTKRVTRAEELELIRDNLRRTHADDQMFWGKDLTYKIPGRYADLNADKRRAERARAKANA